MTCSPEDLEKFSLAAKGEIGECGSNMSLAVETVKDLVLEEYPDLRFPPDINNILERCLRSRKFDYKQAATQVHYFFKFLLDCHTLHREMYFLPSITKEYFFDSLGFSVLKNRDSKGRVVFFVRFDRLPSPTYSLDKGISTSIMVLNELTGCSVDTQRLGVVFVCDLHGYNFGHAKQYTWQRLRAIAKMVQGSLPVRFKGFHVVRCPILFTYTYALLKPLLSEKIRNRVHFHGTDLTQFHKDVCQDILPEYLGGNMPDNDYADLDFNQQFFQKDNYYKELFRHGYFAIDDNDDDNQ